MRGFDGSGCRGVVDALCCVERLVLVEPATLLAADASVAAAAAPAAAPAAGSPEKPLYSFNSEGMFFTIGIACCIYGVYVLAELNKLFACCKNEPILEGSCTGGVGICPPNAPLMPPDIGKPPGIRG